MNFDDAAKKNSVLGLPTKVATFNNQNYENSSSSTEFDKKSDDEGEEKDSGKVCESKFHLRQAINNEELKEDEETRFGQNMARNIGGSQMVKKHQRTASYMSEDHE